MPLFCYVWIVPMKEVSLTRKDIDVLAKTLSVGAKSETIKKIGYYYNNNNTISEEEKKNC